MRPSTCATEHKRGTPDSGLRPALLIAIAAALAGGCESCQEAPDDYSEINRRVTEEMTRVGLGPGDVFEVAVFGEPALSGTHRISPDGAIHFPLVNRVVVEGMTPSEIADELTRRLADGFLRNPSVSVLLKEYNSKKVFVLGEVQRPGTFPFTAGMSIVEAIALSGGFKETANGNFVIVTRSGPDGDQRIPVPVKRITQGKANNFALQPGDIVFVPDSLL